MSFNTKNTAIICVALVIMFGFLVWGLVSCSSSASITCSDGRQFTVTQSAAVDDGNVPDEVKEYCSEY